MKNFIIYCYVLPGIIWEDKKMAVAIVNKFLDALGLSNDNEQETENEDIYNIEEEKDTEEVEERGIFGNKKGKITSMPQIQAVKMVITQPTSFDQSEEICNYLKEKKSIIVNLEYVNKDVARRIIDFLSGAVHALNGHIQKVSNSIFLIAPVNYDIESDLAREELKNKLSVSWLK
jgi:cell division inhibitor SepF